MAKGNILKIDKVLEMNVHKVHYFLAHKIDKQKIKAIMRKGNNVVQL